MSATPVPFDSADPGTPESEWLTCERWDTAPVLDLAATVHRFPRVLVVSAHPDDETLGVGGLVADLAEAGAVVEVLVATDGERSHPVGGARARAELGARRRCEVQAAVQVLAPGASVGHLALPDGSLDRHEEALASRVAARLDPGTLVVAPWVADGHIDHDAVGRACARAASEAGASVVHYPVWLWHWGSPDALPWRHVVVSETSRSGAWRKRRALQQFPSQTTAWGDPEEPGAEVVPMLGEQPLQRGRRLVETLLDPEHVLPTAHPATAERRVAARTARFDEMYDADAEDPWGFSGSFYEERRRALVLAVLGCRRHGRALEVGCADGRLTEALLDRCDDVVALDPSRRAVGVARRRAPGATVLVGEAPGDLPPGPFDLVLVSEVGYFLTPLELLATLRRCAAALAPGGELVLCHWQHPTRDVPLDGVLVHEQAAALLDLTLRATYVDRDLRIDVWGPAESVAELEGRV